MKSWKKPNFNGLHRGLLGAILIGMAGLAAACGSTTEAPTQVSLATPIEPIEESLPTEAVEIDSECLACHNDQQRLIDTAGPELEIEIESSGEG